jgi:hypothetical protein
MTQLYRLRTCILAACILLSAFLISHPFQVIANEEWSQETGPQLPHRKGAWEVEVQQGGGMIYRVEGAVVNSDGEVVIRAARHGGEGALINCSCSGKISGEDLAQLQRAVSSAKPSQWQSRYEKGQIYDAPSSSITLTLRGTDSAEHSYRSSWTSVGAAASLRPADLSEVDNLVWQIRGKMKGHCGFNTD